MIQFIIAIVVFMSVLFVYLHLIFHLKTSNDVEMFEMDYLSKNKLEEVCDMRQPVLINNINNTLESTTNKAYLLNNFKTFDVKIRKSDFNKSENTSYLILPLDQVFTLFQNDTTESYISENNRGFIMDTGLRRAFQQTDEYFRPYMVSNMEYDIRFGSPKSCTPLRYEISYRNYIIVTGGSVRIKLAAPNNSKYLHPIYDYNNFEFRSPIHPWKPQPEFSAEYEKIKFVEFTLQTNQVLFIPAKWWHSIQFIDDDSSIVTLNYKTYMNNVAIMPYYCLYWLQMLNTKTRIVKIADQSHNTALNEIDELQAKLNS